MFSASFENQISTLQDKQVKFGSLKEDDNFLILQNGDIKAKKTGTCKSITAWTVGPGSPQPSDNSSMIIVSTTTQAPEQDELLSGVPHLKTIYHNSIADMTIVDSTFHVEAGTILRLYHRISNLGDQFGKLLAIEGAPSAVISIEMEQTIDICY